MKPEVFLTEYGYKSKINGIMLDSDFTKILPLVEIVNVFANPGNYALLIEIVPQVFEIQNYRGDYEDVELKYIDQHLANQLSYMVPDYE